MRASRTARLALVGVFSAAIAGAPMAAMAAPAAVASSTTTAVCTLRATILFSNGTSLFGGHGVNTSRDGTLTCTGLIDGHRITGPGTASFVDTYGVAPTGQSCIFDTGPGTQTYTLPTDSGPITVTEPVDFFGAAVGVFFAPVFSGAFQILPTDGGTCFTSPIHSALLVGEGVLV